MSKSRRNISKWHRRVEPTLNDTNDKKKERKREIGETGIADAALEKTKSVDIDLGELVAYLENEFHCDRDGIVSKLIELKSENKIRLAERYPYKTATSFLFSPSSLWYWGALLATLASVVLLTVTSGAAIYLRYLFGSLIIFFLPGYSLVELLYSKKKELDELTRLVLSIGLSLALVPLVGLVLNYTLFGIRLLPIGISLGLLTIVLLTLALIRKYSYYKLVNNVMKETTLEAS